MEQHHVMVKGLRVSSREPVGPDEPLLEGRGRPGTLTRQCCCEGAAFDVRTAVSWNAQGSQRGNGVPTAPGMLHSEALAGGMLQAEPYLVSSRKRAWRTPKA